MKKKIKKELWIKWGAVFLVIVLIFVLVLLDRVEKIKYKDLEITFRNQIDQQKEFVPKDFSTEVKEITKADAKKAIELYEKISNQIFGKDVHRVMAYNYYVQERYEETISEVRKVLSIATESKDSSWAYNNWGAALLNLGRHDEAMEKFQKAVKIDPKYGGAYSNWGVALVKLGRNEEATGKFEKAVEIDPKYVKYGDAYSNWGAALVNQGRHEEAIEKFQKAAEINTKDAEVYYNWGVALLNLGRNEEAIEMSRKATEINPKFAEAYSNWGAALGNLDRYEEAIEKFKKAVEINPKYVKAYYNLACAYSRLNNRNETRKNLKKAIELDPKWKEKAKTDKNFDNLRNDPEFKKLISD